MRELDALLAGASVDPAVLALRPDYRAALLAVEGLRPPAAEDTETLLRAAEDAARRWTAEQPVEQQPHVVAWREAYRAFGAKPQRTRNSLEALLRRAARRVRAHEKRVAERLEPGGADQLLRLLNQLAQGE